MYGAYVATRMQRSELVGELVDRRRPSSLLYQLLQSADGISCRRCRTAPVIALFFRTLRTGSVAVQRLKYMAENNNPRSMVASHDNLSKLAPDCQTVLDSAAARDDIVAVATTEGLRERTEKVPQLRN